MRLGLIDCNGQKKESGYIMGTKIGWWMDKLLWSRIIKLFYGGWCEGGWYHVKTFLIWQKIFRINGEVPWYVHPSSHVSNWDKIKMKEKCHPGISIGNYIQAGNGIVLGRRLLIGPNVGLISANHSRDRRSGWDKAPPIRIGDNVWIGMNSVILPGVKIGKNVVIGANSIVTKDIPDDCTVAGRPCEVIKNQKTD